MDASDHKRAASRHLVPSLLVLALALGFCLPACSAQDKNGAKAGAQDDPGQVLAKINGKAVTAGDVRAEASDQFELLEREYLQRKHEILESELKKVVQDRLAKQGRLGPVVRLLPTTAATTLRKNGTEEGTLRTRMDRLIRIRSRLYHGTGVLGALTCRGREK